MLKSIHCNILLVIIKMIKLGQSIASENSVKNNNQFSILVVLICCIVSSGIKEYMYIYLLLCELPYFIYCALLYEKYTHVCVIKKYTMSIGI